MNNMQYEKIEKNLAVILFLYSSLLAGCSAGSRPLAPGNQGSVANQTANIRPIVVRVFDAQPSPGATGGELLIPASISVEDTAVILAERSGRIIKLHASEGGRVRKGDALAEFNDADQRNQLRQAEIEVSRLKVEEQQYEALVKLNRSELERERTLARDGISSSSDVERAEYKLAQSAHEYEKTRLATQSAQERVKAVRLEIEKSSVRAPITGIITRRYITLGTNVAMNDKLFEVSRLSPLEVKFQLPQTERERISTGQVIYLSAAGGARTIATARIRRIDPVADATSNTLGYLADITGGSGLMPGMAVNVHLPRAPDSLTFWVPRSAFPVRADLHDGALSTLFIVEGERVAARSVLVKAVEGDQIEIISGLTTNDRVILMPTAELKDGDLIEISSS